MATSGSRLLPEPAAAVVELEGIVKRFPGVTANAGANLAVHPGAIHAVVGENGSGKSTLMGILAGELRPDAGTVRVDGRLVRFRSPSGALAAGIGMVHQQLRVVDGLTVLENVILGAEPTRKARLDEAAARRRIAELSEAYGLEADPDELVGRLPYADRLRVELLRLLYREGRVLILDEPTATLVPRQAEELLARLAGLTRNGVSIVLVSHRLDEVLAVADPITVMRAGRTVATLAPADLDVERLTALLGGDGQSAHRTGTPGVAAPSSPDTPGGDGSGVGEPGGESGTRPELVVEEAGVADRHGRWVVRDVAFAVRPGEVVGVAGLPGDGPVELLEALAGLRPLAAGRIRLAGEDVTAAGPGERRRRGVGVVLEEGARSGLLPTAPLWENVVLGHSRTPPLGRGAWIDRRAARRRAREVCADLDVRAAGVEVPAAALSGGNQQKLVVGRELAAQPRLLLLAHPTHGVDVAARLAVHDALRRASRRGAAVVLVSSDPEELAALADTVLVLRRGKVAARLEGDRRTAGRIALLLAGGTAGP